MLEGKSSIFFHQEPALCPKPLTDIINGIGTAFALPVICMYWSEQTEQLTYGLQTAPAMFPVSRDFTATLIRLGKLLAEQQYIIVVHGLDEMAFTVDGRPLCKFIGILADKCSGRHSTMLAVSRNPHLDEEYGIDTRHLFDNRFRIEGSTIRQVGPDGHTLSVYDLFGERQAAAKPVGTDMEKIREIFRLTPEEQKELDRIANNKLRDLNIR
ncbi:hypothetical protein PV02_09590 [Methanolobus chelungpuianus]|uniref:Uncharacterized protein n=2 Tax=Methanolobus chelungpuianus TaxID=502115 RepID=A0AAE3HBZ2_9EURY|nr:hypothetical protein [Methanolobus chelungpuianus]